MEYKQAVASLQSKRLQPVYTLVGSEITLIESLIETVRDALGHQFGEPVEFSRFHYDESGCDGAVAQCQTVSLFSEESVVLLSDCTALTSQAKGKQDLAALDSYVQAPNPSRVLIITSYADKLDERKKTVKLLKKFPIVNCNSPAEGESIQFIQKFAERKGLVLHPDAAADLWRRTHSLTVCQRELEKLQDYCTEFPAGEVGALSGDTFDIIRPDNDNGAGGSATAVKTRPVTLSDVAELTPIAGEDNVFRWVEGVVMGNAYASFEALKSLQISGYDVFSLFSLLARQLRLMWYTKTLGQSRSSQQDLARRLGAHPYAIKMASQQARHLSVGKIEKLLCIIADSEFAVKSGRRDPNQMLDWIVLSCAAL